MSYGVQKIQTYNNICEFMIFVNKTFYPENTLKKLKIAIKIFYCLPMVTPH